MVRVTRKVFGDLAIWILVHKQVPIGAIVLTVQQHFLNMSEHE
jgi:hypothetical protein